MNDVENLISKAAGSDALALPTLGIEEVETLSAGMVRSGPFGGENTSAYGPRDFVAITLLIILFLVIGTLGHLAFAVQRWPKRWIPVRVRSRYRDDRDPRWR